LPLHQTNSSRVSLETIPEFQYYCPEIKSNLNPIDNLFDPTISKLKGSVPKRVSEVINHFALILVDGVPWSFSTRYLLSRALDVQPVKSKTLVGIARDLRDFKAWVLEYEIDYLKCERAPQSPVRRYRRFLNTTEYSASVIKRKLSRVVSFYRWLQDDEKIVFDKPLWKEREFKVLTTTTTGNKIALGVKSTDVQDVKGSSQAKGNGYDGYIRDGGLLRPYNLDEQKIIMESLQGIGNTEMTLGFVIALVTGARLQTVFTLRKCHFEKQAFNEDDELILYVGRWPERRVNSDISQSISIAKFVDTKNSKPMKLYFPGWLYKKIQIYLRSERYAKRELRKADVDGLGSHEYVFLTTRARPFYLHSQDSLAKTYLNPPQGASVQQFISKQLKPKLKDRGFESHFKFHNLRATYGMNLVRSYTPLIKKDSGASLTELFAIVQTKMGHSNQQTTQQYLSFDLKQEVASSAQGSYEKYLDSLFSNMKKEWEHA